ncbi:M20/M25/M40 family metallo-hydrolase [Staphylococcus durrellii]|uniref:M20/M25/M40 family metallo-hydrolase n=1 Tax=Staphylococcus durrellii TaxID=2781773 RepID=UPI00189CD644|nr:M20/M25/M40 family metallo-hydrolase [Staphylococcus durrellii]MBF7016299.1 M20/M25/M40 family metallo-hydrolase [Staphylococcus durrellii]
MGLLWQTYEDREQLLKELVNQETITNSPGELAFPKLVERKLLNLDYFQQHKEYIKLTTTEDNKELVTAFYKGASASKTVVLISHFDTVGIDDYTAYKEAACDPDKLSVLFTQNSGNLSDAAVKDLNSGDYLFGRGIMDMKAGLMLHLSLIEKASAEQWNVNLLLVTVPDEEVNSSGMRKAVEMIEHYQQAYNLDIALHLNSEPTFQQESGDPSHSIYSGSIGKIMPGVLCYGIETHVGNPLSGLSSNYMNSYITQAIEYNRQFKEQYEGEFTPLPVSIVNKDIKEAYDVQTPFRTFALYNMFLFNKTPQALYRQFLDTVIKAVERCESDWLNILEQENLQFDSKINVVTYEQLKTYAVKQYGQKHIDDLINSVLQSTPELHLQSVKIADELMKICRDITPAVVTFFAPPYYPAVNSSQEPIVNDIIETVSEINNSQFNRATHRINYFNGISDSSYLNLNASIDKMEVYADNTPSFNHTYNIPFDTIKNISAPIILCGPRGNDAHKVSERLSKTSAFTELPIVLETIIKQYFCK